MQVVRLNKHLCTWSTGVCSGILRYPPSPTGIHHPLYKDDTRHACIMNDPVVSNHLSLLDIHQKN